MSAVSAWKNEVLEIASGDGRTTLCANATRSALQNGRNGTF